MGNIKFLGNVTPDAVQFVNASGTETGRIGKSGDDLTITNAVGDVLFGDGTSDVYIGNGISSVNLLFEQSGAIKAATGSSITLTLGSSDTTLNVYDPQMANGMTLTSTMTMGAGSTIDYLPDTGVFLKFDGQTILERKTANGAITLGHDDSIIIAGGDMSSSMNTNINNAEEIVFIGAEGGVKLYGFPNNDAGGWSARSQFYFKNDGKLVFGIAEDTNLYRSASSTLKTDDNLIVELDLTVNGGNAFINGNNPYIKIGDTDPTVRYAAVNLSTGGGDWMLSSGDSNAGAGVANSDLWITREFDGSDNRFRFRRDNPAFWIYNYDTNAAGVVLSAAGVSYLNGGNVGIGTTSPGKKLHVKETSGTFEVAIFETNSGGSFIRNIDSTGTVETGIQGGLWSARTSGTQRLVIDSSGNVGIGTTSPAEKLEVAGNVILDASNARLKLKGGVTGTNSGIDWTFNTDSTQYARVDLDWDTRASVGLLIDSGYPITLDFSTSRFAIQNNGSEKMRVNADGNVGIGITAPDQLLHVRKTNAPAGIEIQGGLTTITAVGDVHSFINFGTNDSSATGGIAGRIESVTESSNGAHNGLAFYTGRQSRTPYLQQALFITSLGGISFGSGSTDYGTSGQVLQSNGDAAPTWVTANPGDITGVTATSPLTGGGTSGTVTVGIQTASASQAGALSAANWTTFNNKTSNTGTTTASNTQTFTNKSGSNNQWTNDSGYITAASLPTVSNATVTINTSAGLDGGTTSFTLNQSADKTITLSLDLSELAASGTLVGTDQLITLDGGTESKSTISSIPLSIFNNNSSFTSNTGTVTSVAATHGGNAFAVSIGNDAAVNPSVDIAVGGTSAQYINGAGNLTTFPTIPQGDITGVTAGTGMTGGGTSGTVTLNVIGGAGITANADSITVDSTVLRTTGAQTISGIKTHTADINVGAESLNAAGIHLIYSTSAPEIRIQAGESGASAFSIYNTATNPDAEQFFINNNLGTSHLGNARGALKLESDFGVVLTLSGSTSTFAGNIILSGTGRIQGIDTVSANTDAANKLYVDTAVAGVPVGDITGVTAGSGLTGGGTSGAVTVNVDYAGTDNIILEAQDLSGTQMEDGFKILFSDTSNDVSFGNVTDLPFGSSNLVIGTTSTTAKAGDITTISTAQASAITANTAKVSDTGTPAVLSNGSAPSLNTNISAGEMRTLIGAGTSSLIIGTTASRAMAGDTTTISTTQASNITTNNGKVSDTGTPAILSNGTTPSLNSGISAAEVRTLIGAGTSSTTGTVTSVNASIGGSAIGVTGGAITTAGTLAFAFAGGGGEYIDGAGDLQTFPTIPQGDITGVTAGTNLTGGGTSGTVTLNMATGGVGAGSYGSTSNGTKIDNITIDAYGRVTAVSTGATGSSNLAIGTTASTAKAGDTTTITSAQATAITNNTAKVGITSTQASNITTNNAKTGITSTQASNITTNNAKTGITSGQASAITANTAKTGITSSQASAITANTAKVTSSWTATGNNIYNNNSANVGIGTTSPSGPLTVSAGGAEGIEFFPNNFTNGNTIQHYDRANSAYSSVKNIAADHRFNIGTSEAMRVTGTGALSFGTAGTGYGTSGQVLTSAGNAAPTWTTPTTGDITAVVAGTGMSGGGTSGSVTLNVDYSGTDNVVLQAQDNGDAQIDGSSKMMFSNTSNVVQSSAVSNLPFTNISNNNQLTNGAGYITSASLPTVYTPDIWQVNDVSNCNSDRLLVFDTVNIVNGTTGTNGSAATAGMVRIASAGTYEITYSVNIKARSGISTRQAVMCYIEDDGTKVPGSSNTTYLRLAGSNQGGYTALFNTAYVTVGANSDIALRIFWLDGATKSLDIYQANGIQNTVSIRRIT